MSSLSRLLRSQNGLPSGYWVAADDAYICGERIITPWPGRNLSKGKDAFNYWQSSARIHIEQAFGMLVTRAEEYFGDLCGFQLGRLGRL
jgi:hypothetical protein